MPGDEKIYTEHVTLCITKPMLADLTGVASKSGQSVTAVIRQAIREYLDAREDLIGSRSRLGRTVMAELETMRNRLLKQNVRRDRLILAAILILLTEKGGLDPKQVVARITNLALPNSITTTRTGAKLSV